MWCYLWFEQRSAILTQGWMGGPLSLSCGVYGRCTGGVGTDHQVLLVSATDAYWYYTPSLAPVALAPLMRHHQDVGSASNILLATGGTPSRSWQQQRTLTRVRKDADISTLN